MELYPKNASLFCCRLNWLLSALQSPCIGRLLYREKKDERKGKEGAVIAEVGRETKKTTTKNLDLFKFIPQRCPVLNARRNLQGLDNVLMGLGHETELK
jgi:hypothetical protein